MSEFRFPYVGRACDIERKKCFEVEVEAFLDRLVRRLVEWVPTIEYILSVKEKENALRMLRLLPGVIYVPVIVGRNNPSVYPALAINLEYGVESDVIAWLDIAHNAYFRIRAREVKEG